MTTYSNSQLQSYKNCPLQYRFQWELQLRRRDAEASDHHRRFGNAIHRGLEALYLHKSWAEIKAAFVQAYPTQLDLSDKAKTQENGLIALATYIRQYRTDAQNWKIVAVETRSDDPWSVKPDLVVENVEHGGLYLVDHKTTGKYLDYSYWEQYEPNSQITHYLDYAQSKYGPIEGFIINAISFRFREKAYRGEPAGFWCRFERQTFNRNASQLEFERRSRAEWIADLERSRSNGFWRTNTSSCKFCEFKSICAPGWLWETDAELIQIQYYESCMQMMESGDYCVLDNGHRGDCARELPKEDQMEITVDA